MESDQSMKQAAAMAAAARREREAQALRANLARRKAQLRARDAGAADPPAIGASEGREDGAGQPSGNAGCVDPRAGAHAGDD
jgi:hypothetical protein